MTVHNNPRWKEELKSSFYEVIIEKCSQATIEAVKGNEIIKVIVNQYLEAVIKTRLTLRI